MGWSEYLKNCWSTGIFTHNHLYRFTENCPEKRKYPVSGSCVDGNGLEEVKGEWADWLEMKERQQLLK